MSMIMITDEIRRQLDLNGRQSRAQDDFDPKPVVKLFTPDAGATWLISESDPDDPDILFGLCDLGLGCAELGTVRLSEIMDVKGVLGLPVERDVNFRPEYSIGEYYRLSSVSGRIEA